jgi:hypothetical protein
MGWSAVVEVFVDPAGLREFAAVVAAEGNLLRQVSLARVVSGEGPVDDAAAVFACTAAGLLDAAGAGMVQHSRAALAAALAYERAEVAIASAGR